MIPATQKDRDAIRSHLPHIAMMFGAGNFDAPMLVHDSANVPGTKVMTERKAAIRYQVTVDTPHGGRVTIVTTDPQALVAAHASLTFQIVEHKTGDSRRGTDAMTTAPMGPREAARATGVSTDTLRHYERQGFAAGRHADRVRPTVGNAAATVERVLLIQRALVVGFSLADLTACPRRAGPRRRAVSQRSGHGGRAPRIVESTDRRTSRAARRAPALLDADWDARLAKTPQGERAHLLETLGTQRPGIERTRRKRRES